MSSLGQRGRRIWLVLLGIIVALLALASVTAGSGISPVLGLGLVVAYIGVLFLTLTNIDLTKLGRSVSVQTASVRMTTAARKATSRARSRPEYGLGGDDTLIDVGFLINERRRDGRWDRRLAESASFDDGAIQPYAKVLVGPEYADRLALVEYEFYDRSGRLQFSHKMQEYLRQGENLLLCERQLSLRGNDQLGRAGTWDLRVKIDGNLVGVHDFNMAAASETRRQAAPDGEARLNDRVSEEEGEAPVSLEDLLREQARRSSSGQ